LPYVLPCLRGTHTGVSVKELKVDITISEQLVRPLRDRAILRGYDEYSDLPEAAKVRVYSLEEIVVEKIVALADRVRNEPRDLYDAWFLMNNGHVDILELVGDIEQKLAFRGRSTEGFADDFKSKENRLKKLWTARLAAQMAKLPEFENIYRSVSRMMRIAGLFDR